MDGFMLGICHLNNLYQYFESMPLDLTCFIDKEGETNGKQREGCFSEYCHIPLG